MTPATIICAAALLGYHGPLPALSQIDVTHRSLPTERHTIDMGSYTVIRTDAAAGQTSVTLGPDYQYMFHIVLDPHWAKPHTVFHELVHVLQFRAAFAGIEPWRSQSEAAAEAEAVRLQDRYGECM